MGVIRQLISRRGMESGRVSVARRHLDTLPNPPDYDSVAALLAEIREITQSSS